MPQFPLEEHPTRYVNRANGAPCDRKDGRSIWSADASPWKHKLAPWKLGTWRAPAAPAAPAVAQKSVSAAVAEPCFVSVLKPVVAPPAKLVRAVERTARLAETARLRRRVQARALGGSFERLLVDLRKKSFAEFKHCMQQRVTIMMGVQLCGLRGFAKVHRWLFGDGNPNSGAVQHILHILYRNKQEFTFDKLHNNLSFCWRLREKQVEWCTRVVLAAHNTLRNTYLIVVEPY